MMPQREEVKALKERVLQVLRDYYSIDRVPPSVLNEAVRELRRMTELNDDVIFRYVQQMLIPELTRIYMDNVRRYRQRYGWGQVRKVIHFIIGDQLIKLGYNVHIRPLIDSTRVDLLVEYYGKYLPILIRTEKHDKVTLYKYTRLKSKGIPAYVITVTREEFMKNKTIFFTDINKLEKTIDECGVLHIKYVIDRYESALFSVWRSFTQKGYIVFRNLIEGCYMFDLLAIGYTKVGVKKITKSTLQATGRTRTLLNSVARALKEHVIDEALLVIPYEKAEDLEKEFRRSSIRKVVDRITLLPI